MVRKGATMTDQELAAGWDADHRLAATVSFGAGLVIIVGVTAWFSLMNVVGVAVEGQRPDAFLATLVAAILLIVDVALLVFVVGLAYTFSAGRAFGLAVTGAVAALATAVSAALHLTWGYVVATPETELPSTALAFATWLALNLWMLPLFGLLVGATLLALALPLRTSQFRVGRRLGVASMVVGGLLCVLAPFSGFSPEQPAFVAVGAILVATAGISGLLLVSLVRLGVLLWRTRAAATPASKG